MSTNYGPQKPQRQFQPQGLRLPQRDFQPQPPYSQPPPMPQQGSQSQPQGAWQQPQMPPPMMLPAMQAYPPPMTPPSPKKKRWYRQPWGIALIALLVLALCGGGISTLMIHASKPNSNTASTGNSKNSTTTTGATSRSAPQPTPALTQKSNTTSAKQTKPTSTAFTATHGTPHIGGPLSDFVGKYGQPVSQGTGNSENFYSDSTNTVLINVSSQGQDQQVQGLNIRGQASWSNDQAKAFCTQFLPSDAVAFNAKDTYANYHSSIGEVVLTLPGQGTCVLEILS